MRSAVQYSPAGRYAAIPSEDFGGEKESSTDNFKDLNIPDVQCSVNETMFNLLTLVTGSGLLSLPFAAKEMGWLSIVFVAIFCGIFMYAFQLLASSVESYYQYRKRSAVSTGGVIEPIDYVALGKASFGAYGEKIVLVSFGLELQLALVSFMINIGININLIHPGVSVIQGICIGAFLSGALSMMNLKLAAISSALGVCMTSLTVLAIFVSGLEMDNQSDTSDRHYDFVVAGGMPASLGLIAYCYGGHIVL